MLVVAGEAAVLHDPGEGPLDDPAPWQHLEAFGRRVAADDLQDDVRLGLRPFDEATRIATVGISTLDEGIPLARARQHAFAAVSILDVGAMDIHREKPTVGVGQDVALAPGDLLARVVALRAPF